MENIQFINANNRFFNRKIKNPFDFLNDNMLILGSGYTHIEEFVFNYTNELLSFDKKIILIIDKLDSYGTFENINSKYIPFVEKNYPNKTVEVFEEKDNLLKGESIDFKADFNLLIIEEGNSNNDEKISKRRKYFPDLLNNINSEETTVILNQVTERNILKKELLSIINHFNEKNPQLIIAGHDPDFCGNCLGLFENTILFHIYDPTLLVEHPMFKYNRGLDTRDVKELTINKESKTFNYQDENFNQTAMLLKRNTDTIFPKLTIKLKNLLKE